MWSQALAPRFHFWSVYWMCQICFLFSFLYVFFTQHESVKRKKETWKWTLAIRKSTPMCSLLVIHLLKWLMEVTMIDSWYDKALINKALITICNIVKLMSTK